MNEPDAGHAECKGGLASLTKKKNEFKKSGATAKAGAV